MTLLYDALLAENAALREERAALEAEVKRLEEIVWPPNIAETGP